MSSPYIGEIRMFGGNFAPNGWVFCDGQLMPISQNDALFTLIGTTYGGDGQETFGIPNLQSRVPMHAGTNAGITYQQGEMDGVESVTLSVQQIPNHTHPMTVSQDNGTQGNPGNQIYAQTASSIQPYIADAPSVAMNAASVSPIGGSQPHENMQPYLCINFILSLFGIFPTQN